MNIGPYFTGVTCHSLNSFVFVESIGGWLVLYSNWRAFSWRCLLVVNLFAQSIKVWLALPWLRIVKISALKEDKTFPIWQTEQNALQFSFCMIFFIVALTVYELWKVFCTSKARFKKRDVWNEVVLLPCRTQFINDKYIRIHSKVS